MRKQWKLRPFLITVLVAFVGTFLLLTIVPVYFGVHNIITEQTSKSYLDLTYNNRQQLADRIRLIEELTLSISTQQSLRNTLNHSSNESVYDLILESRMINEWLNNYMYIHPYLSSIQVYSNADIPRVSESERYKSKAFIPWGDRLHVLNEFDSMWLPSRSDEYAPHNPKQVITHVNKVFNRRGEVAGYVEVNLDERALWDMIEGNRSTTDRTSFLFHHSGELMTTAVFGDGYRDYESEVWLQGLEQEEAEDFFLYINNGEEFLYVHSEPSSYEWSLLEIIPVNEVYRNVRNLRNMVLIIGACALLLVFPVATFISNRIISPIDRLLNGFKHIEQADFQFRMSKHSIVEIHQLNQSYNQMVKQLGLLLERVEEGHRSKREAELRVLQSQINPHFLYNTLDTINWRAAMQGNKEVSLMITRLAKLLRISLSKSNPLITLREELEHASIYSTIQQVQFMEKFQYVEQVEDEFKGLYVPRTILQPFIENAIIHGFGEQVDEQARVTITAAYVDAESYTIIIEDNGCGLHPDRGRRHAAKEITRSSGYGIGNVDERIKLYYGSQYGVDLHDIEPSGVRVVIRLPIVAELKDGSIDHADRRK